MKKQKGWVVVMVVVLSFSTGILFSSASTLYAEQKVPTLPNVPAAKTATKAVVKLLDLTCEIKAFYDYAKTKPVTGGVFNASDVLSPMYISVYVKNEGVKYTAHGVTTKWGGMLPYEITPGKDLQYGAIAPGQTVLGGTWVGWTWLETFSYNAQSHIGKKFGVSATVNHLSNQAEVDSIGNSLKGNNTCHLVMNFRKAY
jgi:hypothetical protein